ncbi:MAG TPA: hypothetical protein VMM18_00400 [Gemmatimonadaceae bacterium]|nr:hypothetical protein [Gemmatimonadaceae bacterium]
MREFRSSLGDALGEIETGTLTGARTIVVGRAWWEAQSSTEQKAAQMRCADAGVQLSVDERLSRHLVEVRGDEPPLSSELRT